MAVFLPILWQFLILWHTLPIIDCCNAGQNSCSLQTFNQIAVVLLSAKLSIKVSFFLCFSFLFLLLLLLLILVLVGFFVCLFVFSPPTIFKHLHITSKKAGSEPGCQFLPKPLKVLADHWHAYFTEAGHFQTRCRRNSCYQLTLVNHCHTWSTQESQDQTQPHTAVLLVVYQVQLLGITHSPVLSPPSTLPICPQLCALLLSNVGRQFGRSIGPTVWDCWVF